MKFKTLADKMRFFESANDPIALPGLRLIARLDGRGFTRLSKKEMDWEKPFDLRFKEMMVGTTHYLMQESGIKFALGYTQSDEISLLFSPDEVGFKGNLRKLNTILAGEASGKFSLLLGRPVAFDCRISQLTDAELVKDYFNWRSRDAFRNCLSAWCYWELRRDGLSARKADQQLRGLNQSAKQEFLFQRGINVNDLPAWQKRGIGFGWKTLEIEGWNPKSEQKVIALRTRLQTEEHLPVGEAFEDWIRACSHVPIPDQ